MLWRVYGPVKEGNNWELYTETDLVGSLKFRKLKYLMVEDGKVQTRVLVEQNGGQSPRLRWIDDMEGDLGTRRWRIGK